MIYRKKTDDELLELLRLEDKSAFSEIYDRYWAILYRHARKMLQNDEEAKDIVQDVFMSLWHKAKGHTLTPPIAAFLYSATRNRVLTLIKHLKVENRYIEAILPILDDYGNLPDATLIEKELAIEIEKEISFLPPKMQEIFVLSRKNNKTYKEISDQLGLSDKTVKKQISNALKILRSKLNVRYYLLQIYYSMNLSRLSSILNVKPNVFCWAFMI